LETEQSGILRAYGELFSTFRAGVSVVHMSFRDLNKAIKQCLLPDKEKYACGVCHYHCLSSLPLAPNYHSGVFLTLSVCREKYKHIGEMTGCIEVLPLGMRVWREILLMPLQERIAHFLLDAFERERMRESADLGAVQMVLLSLLKLNEFEKYHELELYIRSARLFSPSWQ